MSLFTEAGLSAYAQLHLGSPVWRAFAVFGARWCIMGVLLATLLALLIEHDPETRHRWKETWWSIGVAACISLFLALVIGRVRPFQEAVSGVLPWIPAPASLHSFPSTHSAVIWAWASSASWISRPFSWLWILVAVIVSSSRVLVGVHYLSDVLAGMCVGVASFLLVRWGHRFTQRIVRETV